MPEEKVYYESKLTQTLWVLVIIPATAHFLYTLVPGVKELLKPDQVNIILLAGIAYVVLAITLLHYFPRTEIIIRKDGLSYRRGKITWSAQWSEVKSMREMTGTIALKTSRGWTLPISFAALTTKNVSEKKNVLYFVGTNIFRLVYILQYKKTDTAKAFIADIEHYTQLTPRPYRWQGNEKIRQQ